MPGLDKEAVTIEPWAVGIGLGTLTVVLGMAVFTAWDRTRTASIEDVITPTAVGDTHFVQEPAAGSSSIGLKYQGQLMDKVAESKIRDSRLLRVGTDDSGVYTVYQMDDQKDGAKNAHIFMKVGVNEFIEVKPH